MRVSLDRECPNCRTSGTREFTRSELKLPWLYRVYACQECNHRFKGMKMLVLRIAWGTQDYQAAEQEEQILPVPRVST